MVTVAGATIDGRVLALFAEILDYPRSPCAEAVRECQRLVSGASPEAAALLGGFRAFAEGRSLGELQEVYTGAFDLDTLSDLDATCYPYVGHHIFGESHKRSAFLVGLNERFRAHGFSAGTELPDHLVVLLRFLAACDDRELAQELVADAVVPALERMAGDGEADPDRERSGRGRYQDVLRALALVLRARMGSEEAAAVGAAGRRT